MKKFRFFFFAVMMSAALVFGQKAAGTKGNQSGSSRDGAVKIKKVEKRWEKSPNYSPSKYGSQNDWLQMVVSAQNNSKSWIDEITVHWVVKLEGNRTIVLDKMVVYCDLEPGKAFYIPVYVRPQFISKHKVKSLGNVLVYAEILVNGKRVDYATSSGGANGWWKKVDKSSKYDGELLPQSKTPFAPMDYDHYASEKQ